MIKYSINLVKIFFIICIFYYLYINNHLDLSFLQKFYNNYLLNLTLLILIFSSIFIGSVRWFLLLKSIKSNITFYQVFKIYYISSLFNNILFGTLGGDLVRMHYISRYSWTNKLKSNLTIITDRIMGLIGLTLLGLLSLSIILINYNMTIIVISSIIIFIIIIILFYKLLKFFKKKKYVSLFLIYVQINKIVLMICIFISFSIFLIVHYVTFLICNYIFLFNIDLNIVFFSNFISTLVSALPLTPGGLGLGEASFAFINQNYFNIYLNNLANVIIYLRIIDFIVSLPSLYFFIVYKNQK